MCDLEKEKLLETSRALPEEQKKVMIQEFPMYVILNEIYRRSIKHEQIVQDGKKLFEV